MAKKSTVTVIGLGLMGSALARAFSSAGYALTVWNRTPAKAAPFQGLARIASTVREACVASDSVVVSVLDYAVSNALLRTTAVEEVVTGKSLVQLTTGTPGDARDGETWAKQHGLAYLDGAIWAYPSGIGKKSTGIACSGEVTVFEQQRGLLSALGEPVFCGEAIGAAATLDMALLELSMPSVRRSFMGPRFVRLSRCRWRYSST
jgi:3-hydroxyisobutyrate dehydrogenase-like beta-hydroxyacid dehydrogenase